MKALLFILAIVFKDGHIETYHSFVAECPTQKQVTEMMTPHKEAGEIIGWGGKCEAVLLPVRL